MNLASYYTIAFIGTAIASSACTRFIRDHAVRHGWLDRPDNERHFHSTPVPRLGGVAIFITFMVATGISLIASSFSAGSQSRSIHETIGIFAPASLVFLLGLCDDQFSLGAYLKFGVQAIAGAWLYLNGVGIHLPSFSSGHDALRNSAGLFLTVFWVVLITNAFNLIDGLDGLSAGSALFASLLIFAVSLFKHTPQVSVLALLLAAAIFGFLRHNFHPASIFLGDSGSLFIGFMLSALALSSSKTQTSVEDIAIPMVAFGLPLLDVGVSVIRRFMNNKPLFSGDDDHVHHKLIKRGLSHRNAVIVLYAVGAIFGIASLSLLHREISGGFLFFPIALGVWLGIRKLKYAEMNELDEAARQIWRQKRVTANNLQIRHAIESFDDSDLDFGDICRILQSSLARAGFCGISLSFPHITWMDQASLFPLQFDANGRWSHYWAEMDLPSPQWELKIELTSASGDKLGDLYLLRERASDNLAVDVNLLGNEFRRMMSRAIERAARRFPVPIAAAQEKSERVLTMKVKSVGP